MALPQLLKKLKRGNEREDGFTLVELMVALGLSLFLSGLLLSSLFSQYIAVLAESARSDLRSRGQSLLVNLQDELLFTIYFGEEINEDLVDPNEPTGGWTNDTAPATLIINETALDSVRSDENRHIIRKEVNDCETNPVTSNPPAVNNIIYYVRDNPNNDYKTLYKRTITPTYNLCGLDSVTGDPCTPSTITCKGNNKKQSCPVDDIGADGCLVEDSKLTENVVDFSVTYYTIGNVATDHPSSANKVEVVLTLGENIYGREIEAVINHTIRKIN